jgi:integrase/recombinase XerD
MSPLRQKMIDTMVLKGHATSTQASYLYAVTQLAAYYHRPPDQLKVSEIEHYFLYLLRERKLAPASVRLYVNAVRFLFSQVLERPLQHRPIRYPKQPQRIPELLTHSEVHQVLTYCKNRKQYTMLALCYGAGLRVSEVVALHLRDVDSKRDILHVRQGKGARDRELILTQGMLYLLRYYWQAYRPRNVLFYGRDILTPIGSSSVQKAYTRAKRAAGIDKQGGIHALRHAYATHQLEAGMPVYQLQKLLGHQNIRTTLRYVHWLPHFQSDGGRGADLVSDLAKPS